MAKCKWRIFHSWQIVAANNRDRPIIDPTGFHLIPDVVVPKTDVLYRCECSKVKSVEIPGRWTLAQVTGEAAK